MLEDDFTYVLRKAFKGLALAPGEAALRAGLAESAVLGLSRGNFSADTARRLAPVLGLDPEALARHPDHDPAPLAIRGIHRLDLPFDGERVNAWLIEAGGDAVLFDTGNDPDACLDAIREAKLPFPGTVLITHGHGDHVHGIPTFAARGCGILGDSIAQARQINAGQTLQLGTLTLTTSDLSGHFTPSLGFLIEGLGVPVMVTGDALFAGSMGGCNTPQLYQHALARLHAVLDPLPDATVILPGHGPATTLGEERIGNPFFAAPHG